MSPRGWRFRVEDMLEAIANARSCAEGMTFEQFAADTKTVHAAAYEIGVIGEAVGRIPADVLRSHLEVPWSTMQAMRNVVVHEYFRVDKSILWQTIHHDLPPLVPVLQVLLREAE